MRSSIFSAAPFLAVAYAQSSSEASDAVVDVFTSGSTVSTTVPYTNGYISYPPSTNGFGVLTSMPSADAPVVTSQPVLVTIPAGLPEGNTYLLINISRSLTSFEVSVGSSTTVVVNAPESATIANATSTETGTAAISSASGSSDGSDRSESTFSSSASGGGAADFTGSAHSSAGRVTLASAGVLSFGALVAAFL